MNRIATCLLFAAICLSVTRADDLDAASPAEVLFARDIQPLLAKHCILCHGPDQAEAGLRLDLAEAATTALESGHRAIVPGVERVKNTMDMLLSRARLMAVASATVRLRARDSS